MRAVITARVLLLLGLSTIAWAQTFRSAVDLVSFGVVVQDRKGSFITDLKAEDFSITEEGRGQTIKFFARGDDEVAGPEMHLGLLFDTSGSMEEDMRQSKSAAIKFLNLLPRAADMTVVDFDTEVRAFRYGQDDFPRVVERIRARKADGWTALYDALGVYLDGASSQDGRKVLVLYTDGGDTRSHISFSDTITLLKASDVTAYVVGFLAHQSSSTRMEQQMKLQQIAGQSGGQAFFPNVADDLEGAYEKVLADIRSQYILGYVSTNQKADGTWRDVEIKLTRKDLRNVKLRSRRGYFAPYRESRAPGPQ
ncbi:MAG: VWA domain-containing protein [Acidobacteria bacterium]|nr:VWA domain-containing protein [Acidobacteriota bacterium]